MQKDDVIYRQMAIDAIDECFKKVVRAGNMSAYEYDSAYIQGEIDAYVAAIDTLKTLTSVQLELKWIPCGERLPKEKQSVLVTDGSVIWVCDIISTDEGYKWEDSHGYWLDLDEWTAWMPLPKPIGGDME